MELIFVLLGFMVFSSLVIPWVNLFKIRALSDEITRLRQHISLMQQEKPQEELHQTEVDNFALPLNNEENIEYDYFETLGESPFEDRKESVSPFPSKEPVNKSSARGFEFNFGAKLPVWIGSISLACAAFFLIKLSISAGLLGPLPRTVLGFIFGSGLIATGYYIFSRPKIANYVRIAQGLVGSGLVTLTFCLYASVHLHGFFSPLAGFIGMSALTAGTMFLSLYMGAPIAIFGMIGGFLTPALFATNDPNPIGLFAYLFILFAGLQVIAAKRDWRILSYAALAGTLIWTGFTILFGNLENYGPLLSIFLCSICASTLYGSRQTLIGPASSPQPQSFSSDYLPLATMGGASTLILLMHSVSGLGLFDWGTMGLVSLALVVLAAMRPSLYLKTVGVKLAVDAILFIFYADQAPTTDALLVLGGMFVIYTVLPHFILKTTLHTKLWAIIQIASALLLFALAKFGVSYAPAIDADLDQYGFWGLIALIGAIFASFQTYIWLRGRYLEEIAGFYAIGATSFLSLGLAIELDHTYLPLAFIAEIAALYGIRRSLDLSVLSKMASVMIGLVTVFYAATIFDFLNLMGTSLFDRNYQMPNILYIDHIQLLSRYILPAIFFAIAYILHQRYSINKDEEGQRKEHALHAYILLGASILLGLAATYISLRHTGFNSSPSRSVYSERLIGFFDREILTLIIAGLGVLLHRIAKSGICPDGYINSFRFWSSFLILGSLFRIIYFDGLMFNPLFNSSQHVGPHILFNGVTLAYGSGLALTYYAMKNNIAIHRFPALSSIYKLVTILFLLGMITLNIRQIFHPDILSHGKIIPLEMYSYSAAWLVTGLGLLTLGMKRQDRALRIGAMVFISLTIIKVFIVDASNLDGLYRIFSFLGLGVSLIGLSMFYTRYISIFEKQNHETSHDGK